MTWGATAEEVSRYMAGDGRGNRGAPRIRLALVGANGIWKRRFIQLWQIGQRRDAQR
jgi:hypothetical protein